MKVSIEQLNNRELIESNATLLSYDGNTLLSRFYPFRRYLDYLDSKLQELENNTTGENYLGAFNPISITPPNSSYRFHITEGVPNDTFTISNLSDGPIFTGTYTLDSTGTYTSQVISSSGYANTYTGSHKYLFKFAKGGSLIVPLTINRALGSDVVATLTDAQVNTISVLTVVGGLPNGSVTVSFVSGPRPFQQFVLNLDSTGRGTGNFTNNAADVDLNLLNQPQRIKISQSYLNVVTYAECWISTKSPKATITPTRVYAGSLANPGLANIVIVDALSKQPVTITYEAGPIKGFSTRVITNDAGYASIPLTYLASNYTVADASVPQKYKIEYGWTGKIQYVEHNVTLEQDIDFFWSDSTDGHIPNPTVVWYGGGWAASPTVVDKTVSLGTGIQHILYVVQGCGGDGGSGSSCSYGGTCGGGGGQSGQTNIGRLVLDIANISRHVSATIHVESVGIINTIGMHGENGWGSIWRMMYTKPSTTLKLFYSDTNEVIANIISAGGQNGCCGTVDDDARYSGQITRAVLAGYNPQLDDKYNQFGTEGAFETGIVLQPGGGQPLQHFGFSSTFSVDMFGQAGPRTQFSTERVASISSVDTLAELRALTNVASGTRKLVKENGRIYKFSLDTVESTFATDGSSVTVVQSSSEYTYTRVGTFADDNSTLIIASDLSGVWDYTQLATTMIHDVGHGGAGGSTPFFKYTYGGNAVHSSGAVYQNPSVPYTGIIGASGIWGQGGGGGGGRVGRTADVVSNNGTGGAGFIYLGIGTKSETFDGLFTKISNTKTPDIPEDNTLVTTQKPGMYGGMGNWGVSISEPATICTIDQSIYTCSSDCGSDCGAGPSCDGGE